MSSTPKHKVNTETRSTSSTKDTFPEPDPKMSSPSLPTEEKSKESTEQLDSNTLQDEAKSTDEKKETVPAASDQKAAAEPDTTKRFLPAYKKQNAALTFPEKMMKLMRYVDEKNKTEKDFCISWLPEGKAFVIYNIKEFTSNVIPKFFKASKFCSFTRKLYRWGFRQLNRGIGPDEPVIFGNEYFQRDNEDLMVNMRSITAASIRKRESDLLRHMLASKKRAFMSEHGVGGYPSHHDAKQFSMASQYDQKPTASRMASVMASQQRYGGASEGGYSSQLSHLNNQELQMMYQSIIDPNRKMGSSSDSGMVPVLSDALSHSYGNFGGSSHQEYNMMHMGNNGGSGSLMSGSVSGYMAGQGGNNFDVVGGNGSSGRMGAIGSGYSNGGYGNGMFASDSMYSSGNLNLSQQLGSGNSDITSTRKNLMGGKQSYEGGNYGGFSNMPMNMNINQQLFNVSSSTSSMHGSDEMYYGGQHY